MSPKTRDLIAQASVSLKRSRRLVRDASRALKEAQAHLAELTKAEPPPEPAWLTEAKVEAIHVQKVISNRYGCTTSVHIVPDTEVRVLLKDCVVWARTWKWSTEIDDERVRGLLSEKWRDFL